MNVTAEQLVIQLPDWGVSKRVPILIAYSTHEHKIFAIGRTHGELKQMSHPKRIEADVQVFNPFDINRFKPDLAERMLSYLVDEQYNKRCSNNFVDAIKSMFIDRFDYMIDWPQYDWLPEDERICFEERMRISGRVHQLTINGKPRGWSRRQLRLARWSLFFLTILWMFAPLFVVLTWMKNVHAPALAMPVITLTWVLIGDIFAKIFWLLVFRNILPAPLIRSILLRQMIFQKSGEWLSAKLIG